MNGAIVQTKADGTVVKHSPYVPVKLQSYVRRNRKKYGDWKDPENCKQALIDLLKEHTSMREVGRVLGYSPGTIWTWVHRYEIKIER